MTKCPYCKAMNDFSESIYGDSNWRFGDISVCFTCGGVGQFTKKGVIKFDFYKLSLKTINEIDSIRAGIKRIKEKNR